MSLLHFHIFTVYMSFYAGSKRTSGLDNPAEEQMSSALPTTGVANPHNPSFVTKVPWYAASGPAVEESNLDHQKSRSKQVSIPLSLYTKKGTLGDVKTKFVEGACTNCGATTHAKRDCLERPRKVGARYTGTSLASDDILPSDIGREAFESKRDRWRGFEPDDYREKLALAELELEAVGQAAKVQVAKRAELKAKFALRELDQEEFEERMAQLERDSEEQTKSAAPPAEGSANLRVREDVAKYLLNLDVNSAYYDPKSRSMREDPFAKEKGYKGDNFERFSGETSAALKARAFAWETREVHDVANPTETSKKLTEADIRKARHAEDRRKELFSKYGSPDD